MLFSAMLLLVNGYGAVVTQVVIVGGTVRYIQPPPSPDAAPSAGADPVVRQSIRVTGDVSYCLPSSASSSASTSAPTGSTATAPATATAAATATTSSSSVQLKGPFIPGKNGRVPAVSVVGKGGHAIIDAERSVGNYDGNSYRSLHKTLGLPRGSGFCACWLRGKHCEVRSNKSSGSSASSSSSSSSSDDNSSDKHSAIANGSGARKWTRGNNIFFLQHEMYCLPAVEDVRAE